MDMSPTTSLVRLDLSLTMIGKVEVKYRTISKSSQLPPTTSLVHKYSCGLWLEVPGTSYRVLSGSPVSQTGVCPTGSLCWQVYWLNPAVRCLELSSWSFKIYGGAAACNSCVPVPIGLFIDYGVEELSTMQILSEFLWGGRWECLPLIPCISLGFLADCGYKVLGVKCGALSRSPGPSIEYLPLGHQTLSTAGRLADWLFGSLSCIQGL